MASSIPTLKSRLLTRLQADTNFNNVQITWGHPYPKPTQKEMVYIGNVECTQEPAGLGQGVTTKDEQYTVEVIISVIDRAQAKSSQTLEERAYTIAGYVETSINNWKSATPNYGGDPIKWVLVDGLTSSENLDNEGQTREAMVTMRIGVNARV